jgi:MoaA/NifB/PqqE/SkfB family radical SAM enzyme
MNSHARTRMADVESSVESAAIPVNGTKSGFSRFRHRAAIKALGTTAWSLAQLGRIGPVRRTAARIVERVVRKRLDRAKQAWPLPPKVADDMLSLGKAMIWTSENILAQGLVRGSGVRNTLGVLWHGFLTGGGTHPPQSEFKAQYGTEPPQLLVISPTNACNLRCIGCYADSQAASEKLEWPVLDRIATEATELWGSHLLVLSGGEPLAYRSEGKGVLDLVENHRDNFFIMYTNGTLIDDETAGRMARLGNITPAVSVEGLRERTEARRGAGVYDKILAAMERLRRHKVLFGISLTATRENADEILSDEVMDFYFKEMGVHYAWIFHYMPIGRGPTLKLLPTPQQRLQLWDRAEYLLKEKQMFVADFWNGGTISKGCISAGRAGGFMAINAAGKVSPCVFMPFSPCNINEAYAGGKTLNDVWAHPFFARVRDWQKEYGYEKNTDRSLEDRGNWLMPCPIRDHFAEFHKWLKEYDLEPLDDNALAAATDPEYKAGMIAYNKEVAKLTDPIWRSQYVEPGLKN